MRQGRKLVSVLVVATTLLPAAARARGVPVPCAPGVFALADVDQRRLAAEFTGIGAAAVTFGPGAVVALGTCAGPATVHSKRRVTTVTAHFPLCGGVANVTLAGRIAAPACGTFAGTVRARHRKKLRFSATRVAGVTTTLPVTTTTTLPAGTTTTTTTIPHTAVCGDGLLDPSEACDGVLGCTSDQLCDATCTCVPRPTPIVYSQQLIAKALADGVIDLPTSLLYRGWAMVRDPALPAAYVGDFAFGEDNSLGAEIETLLADPSTSLTPAMTTALRAFSVRPNDPQSYFTAHPPNPFPAGSAIARAVDNPGVPCPNNVDTGMPDWRPFETAHFVVWSCGGGAPDQDVTGGQRVAVGAVAEEVWTTMVPDTGAPRGDSLAEGPAPTDRIDIYIVDSGNAECDPRGRPCEQFPQHAAAFAAVAGDCAGQSASGYIVVPVAGAPSTAPDSGTPSRFRGTLAHEFFHLIEYAGNVIPVGYKCYGILPLSFGKRSWLTEASANWAEHVFFAKDAGTEWNDLFEGFQTLRHSLTPGDEMLTLLSNGLEHGNDDGDWIIRPYEAWLYLYFWELESGGGLPVVGLWRQSAGVTTAEGLTDLLDQRFPFADNFREFNVRNINKELNGDPIDPLWSQVDPDLSSTKMPLYFLPEFKVEGPLEEVAMPVEIDPLAAQYETYTLPKAIRYVKLDFSSVGSNVAGDLTLDIVAHETQNNPGDPDYWARRKFEGSIVEFCRDLRGWDYDQFYLTVSNTLHQSTQNVDSSYKLTAREQCPSQWSGTITFTTTDDGNGPNWEIHGRERQTWTVSATGHGPIPGFPPGSPEFDYVDMQWSADDEYTEFTTNPQCDQTNHDQGTGSGTSRVYIQGDSPRIFLSAYPPSHTYDVTQDVSFSCQAGSSQTTSMPEQLVEAIGAVEQGGGFQSDPSDPDTFSGHFTTIDSEQQTGDGGTEFLHQAVTWDITRFIPAPKN